MSEVGDNTRLGKMKTQLNRIETQNKIIIAGLACLIVITVIELIKK